MMQLDEMDGIVPASNGVQAVFDNTAGTRLEREGRGLVSDDVYKGHYYR